MLNAMRAVSAKTGDVPLPANYTELCANALNWRSWNDVPQEIRQVLEQKVAVYTNSPDEPNRGPLRVRLLESVSQPGMSPQLALSLDRAFLLQDLKDVQTGLDQLGRSGVKPYTPGIAIQESQTVYLANPKTQATTAATGIVNGRGPTADQVLLERLTNQAENISHLLERNVNAFTWHGLSLPPKK